MNPSGDLQLAMRISADVKQALAALTEVQAQIKGLEQQTSRAAATSKASAVAATEEASAIKEVASAQAARANASAAAATEEVKAVSAVSAAQAARAETEAEAAARIKAMVQASLASAEANRGLELSEQALAERAGQRVEATAAQVQAMRAAIAAADADRAAVTAQLADYATLDAVMDGRIKTTDDVAAAEAALDRLQAQSAISATELDAAFAALNKTKVAATGITEANTAANLENAASINLTSGAVAREYGILGGELARGNYTRFEGSLITLANRTGVLQKAMSGTGLAITATAAAIAALGVEALRGYESDQKLNDALLATGNYAGVDAGGIRDMASSISDSVVSSSEAAQALAKLAQSGLFTRDQLKLAGQAAVDFGRLTGQSAEDAAGEIERLASGSVEELIKLNNQYHFLSATQFEWIKQLEEEGKTYDATSAKLDAFAGKMHERAVQAENDLNYFGRVIEALKNEPAALGSLLQSLGQKTTDAERLSKVTDELYGYAGRGLIQYDARPGRVGNYRLGKNFGGLSPEMQTRVLDAIAAYNKLRDAVQGATKAAQKNADAQKDQAAGIAGIDFLGKEVDRYQSATEKYNAEVKKINDATAAAIKADPARRDQYVADQTKALAGAKEAYDRALNKGVGGVNHAQLAADVAAVQNALKQISDAYGNADKVLEAKHKAGLISDQAYYDGLRADLDKYETDEVAALEREKTAATSHIKTAEDRIRADQKVAQIDQQIAQVHADAAAKREQIDSQEQAAIQKSQQEWEALKRSFETPAEVRVDDALAQIAKLEDSLKNVHLTAAQVQQALQQIGEHSVAGALPTYQGVDAAVGGPYGELEKNYRAQAALDAAYQAEKLAQDQKFNDQDQAQAAAHQAALLALDKDYANKSALIQQSRGQLQLQAASNLFGQLATLSSSHNKKIAAIGKAAAIAQTIINTYQSATEAYAAMASIPYIGPALGAAAAAAAIAAGLANVAAIRSQPTGAGYSGGGYTGAGGKYDVAGLVHRGEGVFSQEDISALGGPAGFEALRQAIHSGYADGGIVDAPRLTARTISTPRLSSPAVGGRGGSGLQPMKFVLALNDEQLAEHLLNTNAGEKAIVVHVGNHPQEIQAKWSR